MPNTNDLQIETGDLNDAMSYAIIEVPSGMQAPSAGTFVLVKGVADGQFQGTNAFGASLSYPAYKAVSINTTDYFGYWAATGTVYNQSIKVSEGGVTVSIPEIVVNDKAGTAMKVVITNNSSSEVDVYSSQATLVAKASGQEVQASLDLMAPDNVTTIEPGATVTQVAVFRAALKGGTYSLTIPAFSTSLTLSDVNATFFLGSSGN